MTQQSDEVAIGAALEVRARAIRAKDADATISCYGPEPVRYDLAPPLATVGGQARDRGDLIAWFDTWRGPIRYDLSNFSIAVGGDLGFAYGFVEIGGAKQDRPAAHTIWVRQTVCLRKLGDAWKIVHEHTSTPFYMDGSQKAAVDLAPPGAIAKTN
jgi:PhnB protein